MVTYSETYIRQTLDAMADGYVMGFEIGNQPIQHRHYKRSRREPPLPRDVMRVKSPGPSPKWPPGADDMPPVRFRLTDVINAVAHETGVTVPALLSLDRLTPFARARHMFCAVARRVTKRSMPEIARYLGYRDHTSVLHGVKKVKSNPGYFEPELSRVMARLGVQQ